jgi:Cys-tRNA(Pro) deacylase
VDLSTLDRAGIAYEVVRFAPPRDVVESAASQGLEVSQVVKSLIVRRGEDDFIFVLVPGDRVLDWQKLRDTLGVRRISLPDRDEAEAATGYVPGTITPLGSRRAWPVIADHRIAESPLVAIGAGARGLTVHAAGSDLVAALGAAVADVTKGNPRRSTL